LYLKKSGYILVILLSGIFFNAFKSPDSPNPVILLNQMFDSITRIKSLKLHINALERVEKTYLTAKSEIKLQTKPRRLYFVNRQKKIEILYNDGEINNKALIKSNYMPTISLDPTGNMMRKNQHYTIHELGFEFIGKSIALTIAKDKEGIKNFKYLSKQKKFGYNCHIIQYENNNYNYVDYIVGEKETASSIALKLVVNDYLLRYNNDLLNDFGYLKKGKRLIVPNLYCKKAILYIDDIMMVPVAVYIFDNMGLYESYEYPKIEINPIIKNEEFTKGFKEYRF